MDIVGTILVMAALAAGPDPAPPAPGGRLNVLLIAVDDLRPELGCYGSDRARTPNIDRLAARGVRFERAYCQYPVCNPSRTSMLTGLRPDATGVLDNATDFRDRHPDLVTLPQCFRQHGYRAASFGKIFHPHRRAGPGRPPVGDPVSWAIVEDLPGMPAGAQGEGRNLTGGQLAWCRWMAAEGTDDDQPDGRNASAAIGFLEANRDRPFFLAVGFHKPHDPFVSPRSYFDLHPPDALRLFPGDGPAAPDPAQALPRAMLDAFGRFTDVERKEFLRAYLAGVSFADAQLGRLLDALERLGLRDRTVVVLFGDHGYHLGERGWWNKNTLFEHSARAPLIVAAPGAGAPGRACRGLVEFIDLYPTLTDLCELSTPAALPGTSLVRLLKDPDAPGKDAAFTQVQRGPIAGRSVRTDRYRYTEWNGGRDGAELYDHDGDPQELRNLADVAGLEHLRADLRARLQTP